MVGKGRTTIARKLVLSGDKKERSPIGKQPPKKGMENAHNVDLGKREYTRIIFLNSHGGGGEKVLPF